MKLTKTMLFLAIAAVLVIAAPTSTYADPATADLAVDTTVSSTCLVTTSPVHFLAYDHLAPSPTDAKGSITLNCTAGTTPTISLNQGGGGSSTQRRMQNGTNTLNYNLYQDNYVNAWPIDTAVSGFGATAVADVYGRIPINQNKPQGSYTDTVVVTVVF